MLDPATYEQAFTAWQLARASVETDWNRATDGPPDAAGPGGVRWAAELVRANRPSDITIKEADRLVDALQAPYPERMVQSIRSALGIVDDPAGQVRTIAACAKDLCLHASPPPEPLPEITEGDVHLVCWLTIAPAEMPGSVRFSV